jgi:hypothetical protein
MVIPVYPTDAPPLPRTVVPPHAVGELVGFGTDYGVRYTPVGEDDDAYLTLGHADPRYALAAGLRWARVNYWQRYRCARWLRVERLWAVFTAPEDRRNWHVDYVEPGTASAVPVTLVTGLDDLEYRARPSRCPMCGRLRTTGYEGRIGPWEPWHPDKPTTWVHECPRSADCVGCVWPAQRHTTKEI